MVDITSLAAILVPVLVTLVSGLVIYARQNNQQMNQMRDDIKMLKSTSRRIEAYAQTANHNSTRLLNALLSKGIISIDQASDFEQPDFSRSDEKDLK